MQLTEIFTYMMFLIAIYLLKKKKKEVESEKRTVTARLLMKALPLPLYQIWALYILVRFLLPNFRCLQAENPE